MKVGCSLQLPYDAAAVLGHISRACGWGRRRRSLFSILIDTCVWLDLAKDQKQQALLGVLEELIRQKCVGLILPSPILKEFARNKTRVVEECGQSLSSVLKRVKDLVDKVGDPKRKRLVLDHLNDIESVARIEALFKTATILEISDEAKLRAAQRALDGRAPFHRQKNSMSDAVLIEMYADLVGNPATKGDRFAFVTHNTKDFSATNTNNKLPHPEIAGCFSRIKSLYFTSLGEALRRVAPTLVTDMMIEEEWTEEPRRLKEILDAMDLLFHQVWYTRHMNLRYMVETGRTKIVEKETFPVKDHRKRPIQRDVWEGALKAAARVEKEYGLENLGPWSDFEWGMINGKLSALRWVLGDEWDMLDT
jgi:hypothetical protein